MSGYERMNGEEEGGPAEVSPAPPRDSEDAGDETAEPAAAELAAAELVDPGQFLRGQVNLIARASDPRSAQMVFEISSAGSGDWHAFGTSRAPFHMPLDTTHLLDGPYELRIESRGTDGRASLSKSFGPFVVDNSPPSLAIVHPAEGESLQGTALFLANATDEVSGVARVELDYAIEGEWRELAELQPKEGEVRGFWNTQTCPAGQCHLRARAFDRAGNETSHVISVRVSRQSEPEREPVLEPEPEPGPLSEPGPAPVSEATPAATNRPLLSPAAPGRFGEVPDWDWREGRSGEEKAEPESKPELPRAKPPRSSVAWSWKAEAEPEPRPESLVPEESDLARALADEADLEESGEAPTPEALEPEPVPTPEEEAKPEEPDKGNIVSFPSSARGWNLWELSELLETSQNQDPVQREERRQILYHLREHTGPDGRIPERFSDLVCEAFGELIEAESIDQDA